MFVWTLNDALGAVLLGACILFVLLYYTITAIEKAWAWIHRKSLFRKKK